MKSTILFNHILVRYGGYFVGLCIGILYLLNLFNSNLSQYLAVAGFLMVTVGMFSGLSFGLSSVIQTSADKETAANAGEKFLYATICIALSGLIGFGALNIDLYSPEWLWPFVKTIIVWLLKMFSASFLVCSGGAVIHGHDWLSELLIRRWNRRLANTNDK